MSTALFEIVVKEDELEIGRYPLGPGDYFAGSSPACLIQIPHGDISRKFAKIAIGQNGRVIVEDLESASGTLLDNLPIVVAGWTPGHLVRFGNVLLELWPVASQLTPQATAKAAPASESPAAAPKPEEDDELAHRRTAARPSAPAPARSSTMAPTPVIVDTQPKSRLPKKMTLAVIAVVVLLFGGLFAQHLWSVHHSDSSGPSASAEAQSSFLRAVQLIEDGHFAEALGAIEGAIALQPGVANYYFMKGNMLESLHDFKGARAAYAQTLERDRGHGQATANLAVCDEILQAGGDALSPAHRSKLADLMHRQRRESEAKAMENP